MARRIPWLAVALGVLPWTWYLVRDLSARMDIVALAWPVFGTLAVLGLVAAAALLRSLRVAAVAASWSLCLLAVVVGPWRPLDTGSVASGDAVRIVAANQYGTHTYAPSLLRTLTAQHPDVLVVSELSPASGSLLGSTYRNGVVPDEVRNNDVGVFSDLPLHATPLPGALANQRGWRVVVDGPTGRFVLYALHLQKPGNDTNRVEVGFRTHRRIVDAIIEDIRHEKLPVVVAGDLNLSDRTTGYRDLTGVLDDAMRAGWTGPTSLRRGTRPLLARIDHILVPSSWCSDDAKTFTMRGSDHRGVVATAGTCR